MKTQSPDPVIFDMDGTLFDTERLAYDTLQRVSKRVGVTVTEDVFCNMIGRTIAAGKIILSEALGPQVDMDEFVSLWDAEIDAAKLNGVPLRPGAHHAVWQLSKLGAPLALATSSRRARALDMMGQAQLLDAFDVVVCGDEVEASKPAPDIFLEAARRLEAQPVHCWAIEDSPNGVHAAVAAGMKTIQIPDLVQPDAALRALGHRIAPTLLHGLADAGILPSAEPGEGGLGTA